MRIFLRTISDLGLLKIQYRILFEVKKLIFCLVPSKILELLFSLNFESGIWEKSILKNINFSKNLSTNNKIKRFFNFKFLNEEKKLSFPINWNDKSQSQLWNFNLHYFDWARESLETLIIKGKFDSNFIFIGNLIDDWIDNNKLGKGNGWNSYTISLRIRNWVWIFCCVPFLINKKRIHSLYSQLIWLNNNLEKCHGGNHLLENLISLLICTKQFKNKNSLRIFNKALVLLKKELHLQILKDGGHEERSGSYHFLILDRLLELACVIELTGDEIPKWLLEALKNMHNWAEKVIIADKLLPRFNDSPQDGCPEIKKILYFARSFFGDKQQDNLGLRSLLLQKRKINKTGINHIYKKDSLCDLPDTGWTIIRPNDQWDFIFKCGKSCPDKLPAHAHSDLLSFDLFYQGKPLISEVGTSIYGKNKIRFFERSSAAHNVLQISDYFSNKNKKNWIEPIEVWGNHRAGRKANILSRDIGIANNNCYWVKGSHDAFLRLRTFHERKIFLELNNEQELFLRCIDSIKCQNSISWRQWWHFGPDVIYEKLRNIMTFNDLYQNLTFNFINTWHSTKFGERINRKSLRLDGNLQPGEYNLECQIKLSKNIFLK